MTAARWIEARYAGRCNCGARFLRGAIIRYDGTRPQHMRIIACQVCDSIEAGKGPSDREPDRVDMAYEDSCAAACGFSPFGGPGQ